MRIDVNVGDCICYVRKESNSSYNLVIAVITAIRIGKRGIKLYSKELKPLDYDEVQKNTDWLSSADFVLIQEPFFNSNGLKERTENWIKNRGWEYE